MSLMKDLPCKNINSLPGQLNLRNIARFYR